MCAQLRVPIRTKKMWKVATMYLREEFVETFCKGDPFVGPKKILLMLSTKCQKLKKLLKVPL
jgi:hypothetical protein